MNESASDAVLNWTVFGTRSQVNVRRKRAPSVGKYAADHSICERAAELAKRRAAPAAGSVSGCGMPHRWEGILRPLDTDLGSS